MAIFNKGDRVKLAPGIISDRFPGREGVVATKARKGFVAVRWDGLKSNMYYAPEFLQMAVPVLIEEPHTQGEPASASASASVPESEGANDEREG